jgi:hypothetical protein
VPSRHAADSDFVLADVLLGSLDPTTIVVIDDLHTPPPTPQTSIHSWL